MSKINRLSEEQAKAILPQLIELLQDSVQSGATNPIDAPIGFERAKEFWLDALGEVAQGKCILLVSSAGEQITGAVQLALAAKENGLHRAEVQKLFVHTRFRRRGIAGALMSAVDDSAREFGRTLLMLDTEQGSSAEKLYAKYGYTPAGVIPQYAQSADGSLHSTTLFYRLLKTRNKFVDAR